MSLVFSDFGIVTLVFLIGAYFASAHVFTLGAMSLPSMLLMTSFIYFFVMPALAFEGGRAEFLGLPIYSLEWPHLAVGLYTLGAIAACYLSRRRLISEPAQARPNDRPLNVRMLLFLAAFTVLAIFALLALGRLNPTGDENVQASEMADKLRFLNLFLTMIVPLVLVFLIRDNFGLTSLVIMAVACLVLTLSGFRYRLVFIAFAATAAYLMVRQIRVRMAFVLGASFLGLLGVNFFSKTRQRGEGLNFNRAEGMTSTDILQSFGGEVGPLFSFSNVANHPIHDFYYLEPWTVAIARLVPTFIWADKPRPDYLYIALEGFPDDAKNAGVAIPQHVEILLQFGWIGLPIIAFLYFWFAAYILDRLSRLGREARIAGFALVPVFFGFYMPTRGYFFQALTDGLFTFGPLFLLYAFSRARSPHRHRGGGAPSSRMRPHPGATLR